MSNSIFDQLRDAARRAAQDLDERFDLKNKVEQGIDTAGDMARKAGARSMRRPERRANAR